MPMIALDNYGTDTAPYEVPIPPTTKTNTVTHTHTDLAQHAPSEGVHHQSELLRDSVLQLGEDSLHPVLVGCRYAHH